MSSLALPLVWKVTMSFCSSVKCCHHHPFPIAQVLWDFSSPFVHTSPELFSLLSLQELRSVLWPSLAVQHAEFQLLMKCFHCLNSKSRCTGSTGKTLLGWNRWSPFPVRIPRFFSEVTLPMRGAVQVDMAVLSSFAHKRREFRAMSHNLNKLKWMQSVAQNESSMPVM